MKSLCMVYSSLNLKVGAVDGNASCDMSPVDADGLCYVGKADNNITDINLRVPFKTSSALTHLVAFEPCNDTSQNSPRSNLRDKRKGEGNTAVHGFHFPKFTGMLTYH